MIGAGAGGLVVARGLARAKKRVLLIDKGTWGGDCAYSGCIPSKALIAAANSRFSSEKGKSLGLEGGELFEPKHVMQNVREVVQSIASCETPTELQKEGVHTIAGRARFIDPHTLLVQETSGKETTVHGKEIVIATGASARIPQIIGLENTPYLTNESIFQLETLPMSLGILGGGVMGTELAQAFSRLGVNVFLIHKHEQLLSKEPEEAQQIIRNQLQKEGVQLFLGFTAKAVQYENGQFLLDLASAKGQEKLFTEQLLVAMGRVPDTEGLNLRAAKVEHTPEGISTDCFGRTTQRHIWAIGDVTKEPKYAHLAEHHGRCVLASLLLPWKKQQETRYLPRVTFTDPEVASFGLSEAQAVRIYGKRGIETYHVPLSENDRAITTRETQGFVTVVTRKFSSKVLGGTIVAPQAGEMLGELLVAACGNVSLRKLAQMIHPYPTYNLAIRKAGDQWISRVLAPLLKNPWKELRLVRYILPAIFVLAIFIAYMLGVQKHLTLSTLQKNDRVLKATVQAHPFLSPLIFIGIYILSVVFPLPGSTVLSIVGGYVFSVLWGTFYVMIGAIAGACILFFTARSLFGDVFKKRAGPRLQKLRRGFRKNAWNYMLFLRFVPIFPFWLGSIAPAFFPVSTLSYLWTTVVGLFPGLYAHTQAGAGIKSILEMGQPLTWKTLFTPQVQIALVALAIVALLPLLFKKHFRRRKKR